MDISEVVMVFLFLIISLLFIVLVQMMSDD